MDEQIYPLEEKTEKGLPEKIFEEEDRRMLYQAIRRLDIKKREIIQMQYFGGMTQKENRGSFTYHVGKCTGACIPGKERIKKISGRV